jgi:LemA protein
MKKFAFGCGGILLVLVFVAVVVAIAVAGKYNALVKLDQSVNQSWAQVQNVYQRRADLIPNLVQTVTGAADFEKSTLIAVTNARASVGRVQLDPNKAPTDAAQLEQFQAAQGQLSNALSRLLVVSENYPQLRANENFQQLQAQLEGTENRISVERGNFIRPCRPTTRQCALFRRTSSRGCWVSIRGRSSTPNLAPRKRRK